MSVRPRFAWVLLLAAPVFAAAQTDLPVTLSDSPHSVRFTVGHSHVASYCWGYLDVTADTATYRSLTQPEHSFSVALSSVNAKVLLGRWAQLKTTKNYNFALVDPRIVAAGQVPQNSKWANILLNPKPIVDYILNFEPTWSADWAEIHRQESPSDVPAPVQPAAPPPKPPEAMLSLTTDPAGVQVYLDDVFKGSSSDPGGRLRVEGLAGGSYQLRLTLPGYKQWSQQVTLAGGETLPITGKLEPAGPKPLTEAEIEEALTNGMGNKRIAELVEKFGVDFTLTPEIKAKLRQAGADDTLLLEIATNKK